MNGCGFPNDDSYYTHPTHQENTMTNYDYDILAGQVRRMAYHLWPGMDYECYAYEAAHKLADGCGITDLMSGNPDDSDTIVKIIRDCTYFPPADDEDAGAYDAEYDRGAVVREDADGFLLTTRGGEIRFTDQEDALDAAGLLTLAVSGHNRRQEA